VPLYIDNPCFCGSTIGGIPRCYDNQFERIWKQKVSGAKDRRRPQVLARRMGLQGLRLHLQSSEFDCRNYVYACQNVTLSNSIYVFSLTFLQAECAGLYFEEQGPGFRCPQCSGPRRRYAKKVGDRVGTTLDGGDAPILLFSFGGVALTIAFGIWAVNNL
jgi:hypothetical protein